MTGRSCLYNYIFWFIDRNEIKAHHKHNSKVKRITCLFLQCDLDYLILK